MDSDQSASIGHPLGPMSAPGLGRIKTFVLATSVENLGAIAEAES
jgi:hypothetical protein